MAHPDRWVSPGYVSLEAFKINEDKMLLFRYRMRGGGTSGDGPVDDGRFSSNPKDIIAGQPKEAATGIYGFIGHPEDEIRANIMRHGSSISRFQNLSSRIIWFQHQFHGRCGSKSWCAPVACATWCSWRPRR